MKPNSIEKMANLVFPLPSANLSRDMLLHMCKKFALGEIGTQVKQQMAINQLSTLPAHVYSTAACSGGERRRQRS